MDDVNAEDVNKYDYVFKRFDTDGDGRISYNELLLKYKEEINDTDIDTETANTLTDVAMAEHDLNRDKNLSFEEFVKWCVKSSALEVWGDLYDWGKIFPDDNEESDSGDSGEPIMPSDPGVEGADPGVEGEKGAYPELAESDPESDGETSSDRKTSSARKTSSSRKMRDAQKDETIVNSVLRAADGGADEEEKKDDEATGVEAYMQSIGQEKILDLPFTKALNGRRGRKVEIGQLYENRGQLYIKIGNGNKRNETNTKKLPVNITKKEIEDIVKPSEFVPQLRF